MTDEGTRRTGMYLILAWVAIYSVVVAASILFLGKPSALAGSLTPLSLLSLLLDWRFLLGGFLALGARFIFVVINNLTSKQPSLASAHLSITAVATTLSIVAVLIANHFILKETLNYTQFAGAAVMVLGVFLIFH
jgi:drug/metabolite transporter (DMT)-like permease